MLSKISRLALTLLALTTVVTSTAFAREEFKSGYAVAHDGSDIYYEVHGTGDKFLLFGFQLQPHHPSVQEFVDGLGHNYKLILAEYPPGQQNQSSSEAKLYTFTPAAVTRDYLSIA